MEETYILHFSLLGRDIGGIVALNSDTEIRKTLLSRAYIPNLGSFSYHLKRIHQNWEDYDFGWMPTYNTKVDRFLGMFLLELFTLGWSSRP